MKRLLLALLLTGCAHLSAEDRSDIAEYTAQENACIVVHPGNKALIDECRASVKKSWDAKWNAKFDGGFGDE